MQQTDLKQLDFTVKTVVAKGDSVSLPKHVLEHPRLASLTLGQPCVSVRSYRNVYLYQEGRQKKIVKTFDELGLALDEADVPRVSGVTLNLVEPGASLFSHWLFDSVSKFPCVRGAGINLSEIDWFLFNVLNRPYHFETLKRLKLPVEKVLQRNKSFSLVKV